MIEAMEENHEPALKKQKRTTWSDEMLKDVDILRRDETGMYVLCKICCEKGTKKPLYIKSQDAYGIKSWKKHKASKSHCMAAGKGFASISRFFGPIEGTFRPSDVSSTNRRKPKKCTGIYDTRGGKDKYLSLMVTYGIYDNLEISIKQQGGSIGAFVMSCTGTACVQNTRAYYKDTCDQCFASLKAHNSDSIRFIKRTNNMSTILQAKRCLTLNNLEPCDIEVMKRINLIRRKEADTDGEFEQLKKQISSTLNFFEWKSEASGKLEKFG